MSARIKTHAVFSGEMSPAEAWVLGLLAADGSVRVTAGPPAGGRIRLVQSRKDDDLVEKAAAVLGHGNIRREMTRSNIAGRRYHSESLAFVCYSHDIARKVAELGILSPKDDLPMPIIPDGMRPHFLRGFWDGDGAWCVEKVKERKPYLSTYLSCTSRGFLDEVRQVVAGISGIEGGVYAHKIKGMTRPLWRVQYFRRVALAFAHYLYRDSAPNTRSDRKFGIVAPWLGGV